MLPIDTIITFKPRLDEHCRGDPNCEVMIWILLIMLIQSCNVRCDCIHVPTTIDAGVLYDTSNSDLNTLSNSLYIETGKCKTLIQRFVSDRFYERLSFVETISFGSFGRAVRNDDRF